MILTAPTAKSTPTTETSAVVIEVRFDADSETPVTIEPTGAAPPHIEPGQSVVWRFHGLDDDPGAVYYPAVYFPVGPALTLGPFAGLRQTANEVWATGNSGLPGEYDYLATVYRQVGDGARDASFPAASGKIVNQSETADSAPLVRVELEKDRDGYRAFVEPEYCTYFRGATVLWEIEGLPRGATAALRFTEYEGEAESVDLHFGPFESITWLERKKAILGAGHNDALGRFHYVFEILTVDNGAVVRHKVTLDETTDPVIDREGDPPPDSPSPES